MDSRSRELVGHTLILSIAAVVTIVIAVVVAISLAANATILWDPTFRVLA